MSRSRVDIVVVSAGSDEIRSICVFHGRRLLISHPLRKQMVHVADLEFLVTRERQVLLRRRMTSQRRTLVVGIAQWVVC